MVRETRTLRMGFRALQTFLADLISIEFGRACGPRNAPPERIKDRSGKAESKQLFQNGKQSGDGRRSSQEIAGA